MNTRFDRDLIGDILRIVFLAAFFSTIAFFFKHPEIKRFLFDIDAIRSVLQGGQQSSGRLLSAFIFTLAIGGLIAIGIPRLWASAVAGIVYGAFMGTLISLLASLLGSLVLYYAGRSLLASVVQRRLGNRLRSWEARFQENAFWWVLYGRLFPFSNSTVMSLLCGGCRVPIASYITGSVIGFIPLAIVFATYGSGGIKSNIWQIGFATVLLILSIFSRRFISRWLPSAKMD